MGVYAPAVVQICMYVCMSALKGRERCLVWPFKPEIPPTATHCGPLSHVCLDLDSRAALPCCVVVVQDKMSNGLSSLPVERLSTAAASAPQTQPDSEPGITLTPPTPAVLPAASSSSEPHQHTEEPQGVPKGFNDLEHRLEDNLSADDYTCVVPLCLPWKDTI